MAGGKRKEGQEHKRMPLGCQQLPQRRWEHEGVSGSLTAEAGSPAGLGAHEVEAQPVERHSPGWCPQWLELWPFHPRVRLLVKGTSLGCRFFLALAWACVAGNQSMSLPSVFLPPSLLPFHSKNQ